MRFLLCHIAVVLAGASSALAIVPMSGGDLARYASTPGDNSGWQYEGEFVGFAATPIAPQYFLTAQHIGGSVGGVMTYHGQTFTTVEVWNDPTTDLRLWKVSGTFPTFAPLYQGGAEVGKALRVFGRGGPRGAELSLGGTARGWEWTEPDGILRWGANTVSALPNGGQYLQADFDRGAGPDEAHLSRGDSGGGVFVMEDGLWKLAAINYGVDDVYLAASDATQLVAAIYDARGYYAKEANGAFTLITGAADVPTSFYSTRVFPRLGWLQGIIGGDLAELPSEGYAAWLQSYLTPAEIAAPERSGASADPDGDGVPNLLEFAFNLDPTFAEPAELVAGSGVRGLPAVGVNGSGEERRLTVEYLRRRSGSGSGLMYAAQFSGDLSPGSWQTATVESATPINARWERVIVVDSTAISGGGARFARVQVTAD